MLKPAEETPASPMRLVQCFLDGGLPADVLNLVYGQPAEVSARLIAHDAIRKVSLAGSVAVGGGSARCAPRGSSASPASSAATRR